MAISTTVQAMRHSGGRQEIASRQIPEEVPVELRYNGTAYATMMASPADLEDFAYGFSITEAIVDDPVSIKSVTLHGDGEGLRAEIALHGADYAALLRDVQRAIPGRSGCGICGVRTLEEARQALPQVAAGAAITDAAIAAGLQALDDHVKAHGSSRGVHGAAFCDAGGRLLVQREDVGRHNALDKLIGAMMRQDDPPDPASGFCLITSRCSYEMVQKAVRGGFSTLVALSAPTALALRTAEKAGLTVVAFARAQGHLVFTRPGLEHEEIAV